MSPSNRSSSLAEQASAVSPLSKAFANSHYIIHFMPIAQHNNDGRLELYKLEVLARKKADVDHSPEHFTVELAECGLLKNLDKAVFEKACSFAKNNKNVPLSINLSPATLAATDLISTVDKQMSLNKLKPHNITFEILEDYFPDNDLPIILSNLKALQARGHELWLDDYGAVDSQPERLAFLKENGVKIKGLKFDKSILDDEDALITLIEQTPDINEYEVVVEGIERSEQFDLVNKHLKNVKIQGYGITKPLNQTEIITLAKNAYQTGHINCDLAPFWPLPE